MQLTILPAICLQKSGPFLHPSCPPSGDVAKGVHPIAIGPVSMPCCPCWCLALVGGCSLRDSRHTRPCNGGSRSGSHWMASATPNASWPNGTTCSRTLIGTKGSWMAPSSPQKG